MPHKQRVPNTQPDNSTIYLYKVLESSEEGFYIKDRCLFIFLTVSEYVQTIPALAEPGWYLWFT